MQRRQLIALALATAASGAAGAAQAAKAPTTWDNLVLVKSKRLRYVYLLPDADFRAYSKVMIDPVEVAFEKNWLRDWNNQSRSLSTRFSAKDVEKAVKESAEKATDIFEKAYTDGGYPVVTAPGPDVLRLRIAVININVVAPEPPMAGRSRSYSEEAGSATLVVEARDSETGAILGRAVDSQVAGDTLAMMRTSMSNRTDFRILAQKWSKNSVQGLDELKRMSPINAAGATVVAKN
jgi:hypothetical protein